MVSIGPLLLPQEELSLEYRAAAIEHDDGRSAGHTKPALSRQHRLGRPVPQRILVLRALQLGDLLCAVPAFRALRAALPGAEITLLGLPWARAFVERFDGYLDRFLAFPGYPGLPEQPVDPAAIPDFLASVQRSRFDLVIQMHGSGHVVNSLAVLLGARVTAGYHVPRGYCPDPDRFLSYPSELHEIHRHLRLMEFLGVRGQGDELEFPVRPSDARALASVRETGPLGRGTYVCIHPGARAAERRWPAERFAELGDRLAAQGLVVVLTGSEQERDVASSVARSMKSRAVNLAGRTELGALAALLADARLIICNDTGVSHLAAALRVPSVVIFTASEVRRWAPLDRRLHRVVSGSPGRGIERAWSEATRLLAAGTAHVA